MNLRMALCRASSGQAVQSPGKLRRPVHNRRAR
jgi:hypothetical protein